MFVLLALGCAGPSTGDTSADTSADTSIPWSYAHDDVLRVTDAQAAGTHNSYHLAPDPCVVADWDYSMPTLAEQLALGVRQVELDVHVDDGELRVYHALGLDDATTCATLAACLDALRTWSDANPAHFPLYVQIEPKDDAGGDALTDYDLLDQTLLAHGPAPYVPAELRGEHATLGAAVAAEGWPTLGEVRGRAIYGLDDTGEHRDAYRARGDGVLFLESAPGDSDAALAIVNDPARSDLPAILEAGLLVRVFADTAEDDPADIPAVRDLALASGAHWISSDHPADVDGIEGFSVPDGAPVRCNPVTAPPDCASEDLENPAFIRY